LPTENKYIDKLKPIINNLPAKPGVYQYFDKEGKIIYVGKAKHLKKRVSSYFTKDQSSYGKIAVLTRKIADIKYIVVDTEFDALLLENNLIKKYQPRYNVMLKDDKTYPWICIKKERFPRIFSTRYMIRDGSDYFGPYASLRMMKTILDLIKQLYPLRNCKYNLSTKNIDQGKFKVCLEYHIGNCLGPCEGKQSEEDYSRIISEIKYIIKGNVSVVSNELKKMMYAYAEDMAFEKAQFVKEKIELLEKYQSKSTIVSPKIHNVDVFSILTDESFAYVNYLKVVNGAILQAHTIEIKKKLQENNEDLLMLGIVELRQLFDSESNEIILPFECDIQIPNANIIIPQRGDKKHLLELSERNTKYFRLEKQKQKDLVDPERHSKRILNRLMQDLHLKEIPKRIECFDNSNFQGDYPVAAMVHFRNAKPYKKEYRHYNIKTVKGSDDFASMEEIIYRRYKRIVEENKDLPQLIVVDGGKGQLNAAIKSLKKLNLFGKIAIIGIAKKLEEIYFPKDPVPLYIDKRSESLKIIQQLRDEAHRFGITHHRNKRDKGSIKSVLTEIEGIGYNTAQKLLREFKSVKKIEKTEFEDLKKVIGKSKAQIVFAYFQKK
jgi:excinuclease ABC subunit C